MSSKNPETEPKNVNNVSSDSTLPVLHLIILLSFLDSLQVHFKPMLKNSKHALEIWWNNA